MQEGTPGTQPWPFLSPALCSRQPKGHTDTLGRPAKSPEDAEGTGGSSWRKAGRAGLLQLEKARGYSQCGGAPGGKVQSRHSLRWDELGESSSSSAQKERPDHRTGSRKSPREGEEHWEISTEPGASAHSAGAELLIWKKMFYSSSSLRSLISR